MIRLIWFIKTLIQERKIIDEFLENMNQKGILGNEVALWTKIIKEFGAEHIK